MKTNHLKNYLLLTMLTFCAFLPVKSQSLHAILFADTKDTKVGKCDLQDFNNDMPRKIEPFVRTNLIASHCKTYYYEFRNGTRLIHPTVQKEIRALFSKAGWNQEVHFDSYVEDYDW